MRRYPTGSPERAALHGLWIELTRRERSADQGRTQALERMLRARQRYVDGCSAAGAADSAPVMRS